ncbi:MAG: hypothetical protein HY465_05660, partial [Deltaproteobacteria bacterium]|nr:hypothetical protein [Deltaproteobacteria bacterium]
IIDRLDRPGGQSQGTIHVHYLKYANAVDLAATLSSITSGQKGTARTPATAATAGDGAKEGTTVSATSAVARLEGGITIGADKETNALIITASPKDYQVLVSELISKLDIPRNQVYLESLIMELAMGKTSDYGLRGYGGLGAGPVLGFGQTFSAASQFTNFFTGDGVVGGVIGRDTIDITVPTLTGGTMSSQDVSIPAFAGFLNLIQTYTDANIVSSPNLLTLDNEQAEINVTQKIYANKVTQTAQGFQTTEPTPLESGLILKLTPQISEGEAVRLKIEQELSNFTGEPGPSGAAPSTKRKVSTTVITNDGETVVLGGLMQDNVTHSKHKIPVLGDIPVLGLLFRTSQSRTAKSNLLIFITPHIIRSPGDFDIVMKRKIEERNRFIEDNYGSKQQKQIRDTLAAHREDLLAFVPQAQPTPAPVTPAPLPPPAPTTAPAAPPPAVQQPTRPQAALPPPPQTSGPQPVITAPSIDIGRPTGVSPSAVPTTPPPRNNNSSRVSPPPPPSDQPKPPTELNLAY